MLEGAGRAELVHAEPARSARAEWAGHPPPPPDSGPRFALASSRTQERITVRDTIVAPFLSAAWGVRFQPFHAKQVRKV